MINFTEMIKQYSIKPTYVKETKLGKIIFTTKKNERNNRDLQRRK
jgi:hypothetical protein